MSGQSIAGAFNCKTCSFAYMGIYYTPYSVMEYGMMTLIKPSIDML